MTDKPSKHSVTPRHRRRRSRSRAFWVASGVLVVGAVIVAILDVTHAGQQVSTPVTHSTSAGDNAGAGAVGSVAYTVPAHALFVSTTGNDAFAGTKSRPVRTVQQAVTLAHVGETVILRGGVYNQRVTIPAGKRLTIEPYPHEAVWFDGSTPVTNWRKDGSVWVSDGWTTQFDDSPTFTKGAPPSTMPGFDFINPAYPLASHPDQIWIGGDALLQVATRADVSAGTFAVDYSTQQLFIGSNPAGHEVRASNKTKAFAVQAAGTILRGIGVRRYGTPLPEFGAVTVEAPSVTIEDLRIEEDATTGLFVGGAHGTVKNVTLTHNGMLGMNANYADDLLVSGVDASYNNLRHFNSAPVAGGFKISRSRGISISHSAFDHNLAGGLWFDQSDYNATVLSNSMSDNRGQGISMEISAKFIVAANEILNNSGNGIKLNDTNDVQVWNNTVANNGIDLRIAQDTRRATDASVPGHNPHRPANDPTMPWLISDVTVSNNVFSGSTNTGVVTVRDTSGQFSAEQLGVYLNRNVYQRTGASSPPTLILWERGGNNAESFASLASFSKATGQEKTGTQLPNGPASEQLWLRSPSPSVTSKPAGRD